MIFLTQADALNIPLADESIQCVVTSPPYWGLRSYATGSKKRLELGTEEIPDCLGWATGNPCGQCYICHLLQWTREVKRVLRKDGTFWLNIGDSYMGSGIGWQKTESSIPRKWLTDNKPGGKNGRPPGYISSKNSVGLKPKDLAGIPFRAALALQLDGWYLRRDIIWHKSNPMPESVTDRPTNSHEYMFFLTKSARYFYDREAVREKYTEPLNRWGGASLKTDTSKTLAYKEMQKIGNSSAFRVGRPIRPNEQGRNLRDVWTIPTAPYSGAHFAVFPPKLVEPCIKAGTSERGCCPHCGKAWVRIIEKIPPGKHESEYQTIASGRGMGADRSKHGSPSITRTIDWRPDCKCPDHEPVPCNVLDPFAGSGTTLLVSRMLGRNAIGLDLSATYVELAKERLGIDKLEKWRRGK